MTLTKLKNGVEITITIEHYMAVRTYEIQTGSPPLQHNETRKEWFTLNGEEEEFWYLEFVTPNLAIGYAYFRDPGKDEGVIFYLELINGTWCVGNNIHSFDNDEAVQIFVMGTHEYLRRLLED